MQGVISGFLFIFSMTAYSLFRSRRNLRRTLSASKSKTADVELSPVISSLYKQDLLPAFTLYATGGGAQVIPWLIRPGSSRSIMNACIPYSVHALRQLVPEIRDDENVCSEVVAVKIARSALKNAAECLISGSGDLTLLGKSNVFGVGCTAALITEQMGKGAHRFHVASYSPLLRKTQLYTVELDKGRRDREGEDYVCSRIILEAIASASGMMNLHVSPLCYSSTLLKAPCSSISSSNIISNCSSADVVTTRVTTHSVEEDCIDKICAGQITHALFVRRTGHAAEYASAIPKHESSSSGRGNYPNSDNNNGNGDTQCDDSYISSVFACIENIAFPSGTIVYPGSFHPLHDGHLALVVAGLKQLGWTKEGDGSGSDKDSNNNSTISHAPVVFEIAAVNVDKPPLTKQEILRRLKQFDTETSPLLKAHGLSNIGVCVTSKPLFIEKAQVFGNCTFLVGADTFTRIVDPKYYKSLVPSLPAVFTGERNIDDSEQGQTSGDGESDEAWLRVMSMAVALSGVAEQGCRFIVGGRTSQTKTLTEVADGRSMPPKGTRADFETLESILQTSRSARILPEKVISMFTGLMEPDFRIDISSTEIRQMDKVGELNKNNQ